MSQLILILIEIVIESSRILAIEKVKNGEPNAIVYLFMFFVWFCFFCFVIAIIGM